MSSSGQLSEARAVLAAVESFMVVDVNLFGARGKQGGLDFCKL